MHKANLSYELTKKCINRLVEKDLITQKDGPYYLTDKGKKLLELLKEKKTVLDKVTAQIKEI